MAVVAAAVELSVEVTVVMATVRGVHGWPSNLHSDSSSASTTTKIPTTTINENNIIVLLCCESRTKHAIAQNERET